MFNLELTETERSFLLQVLERVSITGRDGMKLVIDICAKLEKTKEVAGRGK